MVSEITSGAMQKLLGVGKVALRPRQARHRQAWRNSVAHNAGRPRC
jgi:hypothetical protein